MHTYLPHTHIPTLIPHVAIMGTIFNERRLDVALTANSDSIGQCLISLFVTAKAGHQRRPLCRDGGNASCVRMHIYAIMKVKNIYSGNLQKRVTHAGADSAGTWIFARGFVRTDI